MLRAEGFAHIPLASQRGGDCLIRCLLLLNALCSDPEPQVVSVGLPPQ
jgi:hypothetical protein